MNTYQKYLPINPHDQKWGLYALNVGFGHVPDSLSYPSLTHPSDYYFNWKDGRILSEYQLIYITRGEGVFESERGGTTRIQEGSIILVFPQEWHRYKPDENTGWNEYWVGFKGAVADQIIKNNFFSPNKPVIHLGYKEELIELYYHITEKTKQEQAGYQQIIAGQILHLLGKVYASSQEPGLAFNHRHLLNRINKAKLILRENAEQLVSLEEIAASLGLSYSLFRKAFKQYTGVSPGQYLIQVKIERAKIYLTDSEKMIKEIAYELGFDSCFYFSKLFKDKTGVSPDQYRKKLLP